MGRQRYAAVLREELVRLVLEGQSVASLARDFETLVATIPKWIILPFNLAFAFAVTITASTFKKYL